MLHSAKPVGPSRTFHMRFIFFINNVKSRLKRMKKRIKRHDTLAGKLNRPLTDEGVASENEIEDHDGAEWN